MREDEEKATTTTVQEFGQLLTAAEVAERLGYSERYVWKLGREGVLPRVKVPGRKYVRFCEVDVDRFVRAQRQRARPARALRSRPTVSPVIPQRF